MAFGELGIHLAFQGEGAAETAVVDALDKARLEALGLRETPLQPGKVVLEVDPAYYRPTEVDLLIGDATKARTQLGWTPRYSLDQLVAEMVQSDLQRARRAG
jgi:GDP-D-mannose dehydratase